MKSVPSREMAVVLQTLAGLVAREARAGRTQEMIWTPHAHPAYRRWFDAMRQQTGAQTDGPYEIGELVERYRRRGVVRGYVVYRYDKSARRVGDIKGMDVSLNIATSLCVALNAIAVAEDLEDQARSWGLPRLADARAMTEGECFKKYQHSFSRQALAIQDPQLWETRAEMVAWGAFVCSQPGALYEKALERLEPDSPILGWGTGGESAFTLPSTQWGHFQTATTFCLNLPALCTERIGETIPRSRLRPRHAKSLWDLTWRDNVHYVAFLMSDGDNNSWIMADFVEDAHKAWWSNPHRGAFPMGWTFPYMDLAQINPYALQHLFETASSNDDLVLMGGGYYYPDRFGEKRADASETLRRHVMRVADYMRFGGLNLIALNAQDWDSPSAVAAYTTYAREIEDLLGILVIQYSPYTAGGGEVIWVRDKRGDAVPVISARFGIWNNARRPREGSPSQVAEFINAMPHEGAPHTAQHFSWVVVHAWSWFKPRAENAPVGSEEIDQSQGGQPGTARGLTPVKWCVDALKSHVQVVTPTELVWLMRLHLRPQQTLHRGIASLTERLNVLRNSRRWSADTKRRLAEAQRRLDRARQKLARGDYRGCFEEGKAAHQVFQ